MQEILKKSWFYGHFFSLSAPQGLPRQGAPELPDRPVGMAAAVPVVMAALVNRPSPWPPKGGGPSTKDLPRISKDFIGFPRISI